MNRRGFFLGFSAFLAAPSIVRASNLMPVSTLLDPSAPDFWMKPDLSGDFSVTEYTAGWWTDDTFKDQGEIVRCEGRFNQWRRSVGRPLRSDLPRYEEVPVSKVPAWVINSNKTFLVNRPRKSL